jgi:acyl carrier protein
MEEMNWHKSVVSTTTTTQLMTMRSFTLEDIQDWLVTQIAEQIGTDPDTIDLRAPFSSYGLTSLQATSITALGKQLLGVPLSPLMLWNFPNIQSLSQFLVTELATSDREMLEI